MQAHGMAREPLGLASGRRATRQRIATMRYRRNDSTNSPDSQAGLEAADWLLRLQTADLTREESYPDLAGSWEAFLEWLNRSPGHVRAFLEIIETDRRLRS